MPASEKSVHARIRMREGVGRAGRANGALRSPLHRCATALLALAFTACSAASSRGTYHWVRRGESLSRIGNAYGVDYREIARRNGISDPSRIYVGQRIFIPGRDGEVPLGTPGSLGTGTAELGSFGRSDGAFGWPVDGGRVGSTFGPRGGSFHDGIDILAAEGTLVCAARAGRIIYSGRKRGYGNVVIIEHEGDWVTLYAHNSRNVVRNGAYVSAGTPIAYVGRTGRATAPNVHFEIRRRNVARDPLRYLPPSAIAEATR